MKMQRWQGIESGGSGTFTIIATGTDYTEWYDVSDFDELITFVEATWTNQSGATLDVSLETQNGRTETAFDLSSAHAQLTDTGSNHKAHSAFGLKVRLKLVAGGTFGSSPDESISVTVDFAGKSV